MAATMPRPIRVPDEEWHAALAAARANGETLTDVVRRALRAYAAGDAAHVDWATEGDVLRNAAAYLSRIAGEDPGSYDDAVRELKDYAEFKTPGRLPGSNAAHPERHPCTDYTGETCAYTHEKTSVAATEAVIARDLDEACAECLQTLGRTCQACHDEYLAQQRAERAAEARAEREEQP